MHSSWFHKRWVRLLLILGVWLIIGALYGTQSWQYRKSSGQEVSLDLILPSALSFSLTWALLTPVILALAKRFRIGRERWPSRVLIHLLLAFCLASIQQAAYNSVILLTASDLAFTWDRVYRMVLAYVDFSMVMYFAIVFVSHAFEYYRHLQAEKLQTSYLQAELASAHLEALKMQLHPHFLFNTLNTISVLIRENPQAAAQMVDQLSDFLRAVLQNQGAQEITLRQELAYVRTYLQIEQTRFDGRLVVKIEAEPDTLEARVPNLILQPVVENAVRHGIARRRGPGVIEISAERCNGELHLQVFDDGQGLQAFADPEQTGSGVGLKNTRARLQALYGEHWQFELSPGQNGGTFAEMTIPFQKLETDSQDG